MVYIVTSNDIWLCSPARVAMHISANHYYTYCHTHSLHIQHILTYSSLIHDIYLYTSLMTGYFVFQGRYAVIDRSFRSPLGVYGATFAMIIFAMIVYSIVIMQNDGGFVITFMIIYGISCTIYYHTGPYKHQVITDEEFRCNVINANFRRKHGGMILRILRFIHVPESQIKRIAKMSSRMSNSGSNNNGNGNGSINSNKSNSISSTFSRPLEALRHHSSSMMNTISNTILPNRRTNQVSPASGKDSNQGGGGGLGIPRSPSNDSQKSNGSSNNSVHSHIDANLMLDSEASDIRRGTCGGILVTSMNEILSEKVNSQKKRNKKRRDKSFKVSEERITETTGTHTTEFVEVLPTNGFSTENNINNNYTVMPIPAL